MILLASFSGSALTDEDGDDIQWMPPGVHEIEPSTPDGEVKKITVLVDEAAAKAVEEARARYQAEFDAGRGDAPFTDFCHADQEASSWVLRVYWGGDDPKKGGIRAVVDWTDEGRAKKGKSLKRFSPGFYVSDEPDAEGRYRFRSILPAGYACPPDGVTQQLLDALGRHGHRPAHIHFFVVAPGYRKLTTQINIDGDPLVFDDFAYATREGLVPPLVERTDAASIQANGLTGPFAEIVFDLRLSALVQGVDNQIVERPRLAA